MTSRKAPARGAAAALIAAAAVLLTGCGSAPEPAPRASASAPAADPNAAFLAEVAARCAGATAAPTKAGTDAAPQDPEARKYAENHAYRQQTELSPQARCRGEAHAARIRSALVAAAVTDSAQLAGLLRGLGYPAGSGEVYEAGGAGGPGFALLIPGTGPCVSGRPGAPARIEAHGVYVEGGCKEPAGGH
ncbi:hypothetical protein [Streptomyces sp. NBC_00091]|uniref:hypothetical protein n=1 Tax=Streptomyces sp. NBC_00091 TaxID=2975648 RepID=UPI00224D1B16|nr:hypothetical protein [Streptomyces sp. NBC_00091]MCX5379650.1 hypothetical protein [Streptomyces sp. NBC_00091]